MRACAAPSPLCARRLEVPFDHRDLVIMRLTFIRLTLNGVFRTVTSFTVIFPVQVSEFTLLRLISTFHRLFFRRWFVVERATFR
ncbi:MAG: hypothetical protein GPOALKHO_001497 [Sodalis sp.]|nr:MAG: hypothetical protein GPOALKHO_001497 [Sodalis sp.]